jgi:hypothetical protein
MVEAFTWELKFIEEEKKFHFGVVWNPRQVVTTRSYWQPQKKQRAPRAWWALFQRRFVLLVEKGGQSPY